MDVRIKGIRQYFLACVFLFTAQSCSIFTTDKVSEGIIQYDITYPGAESDDLMAGLMPSEMKLHFKEGKTCGELSAGMGMFTTALLSFPDKKLLTQTVKIMNKKFMHTSDSKQVEGLITKQPKMNIEFVPDTKVIAGYTCKKAIITIPETKEKYEVYYTRDIKVKNPNWFTPFREIDGVLMEYKVKQYNVEMKFTAKNVMKETVDEKLFEVPNDYKNISQKEMDDMFMSFN
jgi:GLPGLI family protein